MSEAIEDSWKAFLGSGIPAASAIETLRKRFAFFPAAVVGGCVRDAWLGLEPNDVDLVVDAPPRVIQIAMNPKRRNGFGGFKCDVDGVEVDVWPLLETWAFRKGFVHPATLRNLPKTTFFDVEACAIELQRGTAIEDGGMVKALDARVLDVVLDANPFPTAQVARAAHFCRRYGLKPSERLKKFVRLRAQEIELRGREVVAALREAQASYWGRPRLDDREIVRFLELAK